MAKWGAAEFLLVNKYHLKKSKAIPVTGRERP
jgi:hypothetical protein